MKFKLAQIHMIFYSLPLYQMYFALILPKKNPKHINAYLFLNDWV